MATDQAGCAHSIVSIFIFSAQLWRLTENNTLENKSGPWKFSDKRLSIPVRGKSDFIVDNESGEVLGLEINGTAPAQMTFSGKFDPKAYGEFIKKELA